MPSTSDEWRKIAEKFEDSWDFPNCIGAVAGRHITLQAPITSRNDSNNYKSQLNIVLMGAADADCNFIFVDTCCERHISDCGILKNCELYKRMESRYLNLPKPSSLAGREMELPYVLLGDVAFTLNEYIMKPYIGIHPNGSPKQIFNYRLSRAHHVIENAFGIASSVFRVLRKPMILEPQKAELIVRVVVCLHNFLRSSKTSRNIYTPPGSLDVDIDGEIKPGSWRNDQQGLTSLLPFKHVLDRTQPFAREIRKEFTEYFCSFDTEPGQNESA